MIPRRNTVAGETKRTKRLTIRSPSKHPLPHLNSDDFSSIKGGSRPVEALFSISSNSLSQYFLDTIEKLKGKSIIYFGLMMELKDIRHIL